MPVHQDTFRIEKKSNYHWYIAGGILFGLLLIYISVIVDFKLHPSVSLIALAIISLYLILERIYWKRKGIRVVEIDYESIVLYIGKEKNIIRINKNTIQSINILKWLNKRTIKISYHDPSDKAGSFSNYKITNDSFKNSDFTSLIEVLKKHFYNLITEKRL